MGGGDSKRQRLPRKTVDENQHREVVQSLGDIVATDLQFKLVLRHASWPGSLCYIVLVCA